MIEGHVNERLEAIVSIEVYSSQGRLLTIDAIVDTGFTEYLTLPETFVRALGFDFKSNVVVNLANGESTVLAVGDATLRWGDADSKRTCVDRNSATERVRPARRSV
jgi:predicted aspartyl protease